LIYGRTAEEKNPKVFIWDFIVYGENKGDTQVSVGPEQRHRGVYLFLSGVEH
jgi:hypothetical protein